MVSISPFSSSSGSASHASSTMAFKPAVPTPPQAPTQTPTGTGTTGTGPLAPHFNGSRNDAVAAMTDRAHTALFGNLGQQTLAAVTRGPDFSADHALTALRFENRDAFAEMAERHDHAGQRRIAGEVAEVLVQTFTRDGISGVFGYHMMSRAQQDTLLADAMDAAREEDQIIRNEDRGGRMPASARNPDTASPQTPERDPFEYTVPDLGPTTPQADPAPPGPREQNTDPVGFTQFDNTAPPPTPTPSPEQVAAEAELAREALLREGEAGALQEEVGGIRGEQRAVIVDGRARDAIRDEERNLRGGGVLGFETGPLTDPASIAQLFGNLRERADEYRVDGRSDIADALMRQLSERYPDFAGQAGGGVQGPGANRNERDRGREILRELEEQSRRTGTPLETLVEERARELRDSGQGELALTLQSAFASAYANIAGPTGGQQNERLESSAEINRIRQAPPEDLAGEINEAGDLSGYHEEELKAIMQRLLGAQSASENITAALERIGRALPEVTAEMLREFLNGAVQNALTPAVMNGEVLREFLRNFIIENPEGAAVILFDGDKFSDYNNATSFIDGDNAIELMTAALVTAIENLKDDMAAMGITVLPGRDGGDEFIVALIPDSPEAAANLELAMKLLMNELYAVIQQYNRDNETSIPTLSGAGGVINEAVIEGFRERARQEGNDEIAAKTDEELINRMFGILDHRSVEWFKDEESGDTKPNRGGFGIENLETGETEPHILAPTYPMPDGARAEEYRRDQGGMPDETFFDPDATSASGGANPNRLFADGTSRPQLGVDTSPLNPDQEDFQVPRHLRDQFMEGVPGNTDMEKLSALYRQNNIEPPFVRLLEEGIRVQTQPAIHEHFAALFEAAEDGTALTKIYIEPRQMKALNDEAFIELPDGTRMPVGHAGGNEMLDDLWRALHQAMVEFFGADYQDSGAAGGRDRSKRQVLVVPPGTDQQTVQELMRRAHEIFSGMMPTFTGPDGNDYPIMLEGEDGSAVPFRYNLGFAAGEITKGAYETGPDGYDPGQSRYDMVLSPDETERNFSGPILHQSPLEIATGFVDGAIPRDAEGNLPPAVQNFLDQLNAIPGFGVITPADDPDWPVAGD